MATIISQILKKYSIVANGTLPVRSTASATANVIRNVGSGFSAGVITGKIVVAGTQRWIEVMQVPFSNGFVNSSGVKIFNEQKKEVFLLVTQTSPTTYTISFVTTLPEPQAKSEIEQFVTNEQNVFASLGRSQALLNKIPKTVNVTTQQSTVNTLTLRYNKRQQSLGSIKGFQTSVANFSVIKAIKTISPASGSLSGLGAVPALLLVPVVKWGLLGVTALVVWAVVSKNKSEGLSDLRLCKDVESILSLKLSEEERKKVIAEFDKQRVQAFAEGKKASVGTIGQIGNLLKWGVIGIGVAIIAKKVFFKN
jgi:hypothetical protein